MADDLRKAARYLMKALSATNKAAERYAAVAMAIGRESGNPTARGLDGKQVRRRIKEEVIARLSPKPTFGMPDPILQFDGAPEARRRVAANPLPGLT